MRLRAPRSARWSTFMNTCKGTSLAAKKWDFSSNTPQIPNLDSGLSGLYSTRTWLEGHAKTDVNFSTPKGFPVSFQTYFRVFRPKIKLKEGIHFGLPPTFMVFHPDSIKPHWTFSSEQLQTIPTTFYFILYKKIERIFFLRYAVFHLIWNCRIKATLTRNNSHFIR